MSTNFDKMTGATEPAADDETSLDVIQNDEGRTSLQLVNFTNAMQFDSSDIVIPRLRLAQGLTAEVQDGTAKPGQWLLTGYDPIDELTVVPLLFSRNRTLRDDAGSSLCRSSDSITGIGVPGGLCAQCPMNQWTDGANGARIPPVCVFSYTYICYVAEYDTLGLVEFRRTSIQAGKTLNTICAQKGIGNFAVKLRNSKQQGKRGTFYQIVVQPVQVTSDVIHKAHDLLGQ